MNIKNCIKNWSIFFNLSQIYKIKYQYEINLMIIINKNHNSK